METRLPDGEVRTLYDVFVSEVRVGTFRSRQEAYDHAQALTPPPGASIGIAPRSVTPLVELHRPKNDRPCGPNCPLCAEPMPDPDPQTPLQALALNNAYRRQRAAYHEMTGTTVRKVRGHVNG